METVEKIVEKSNQKKDPQFTPQILSSVYHSVGRKRKGGDYEKNKACYRHCNRQR